MSFEELRLLPDLSQSDLDTLNLKCFADAQNVGGHLFYKGEDKGNYPKTTFTFRGKRYQMRKTQLGLFLKMKRDNEDVSEWEGKTVSHLCHKKACFNMEHLKLETLEHNCEREECKRLRRCVGHEGRAPCVI